MIKKILFATLTLATVWIITRLDVNFGSCLDTDGNGKVYNGETIYNYISYKDTNARPGDVVLTVEFLNPFNTYNDDIIKRLDFIVSHNVTEIF